MPSLHTIRWELWVRWRRLLGRCIHNSKTLVMAERTRDGRPYAYCNECFHVVWKAPVKAGEGA